MAAERIADLLPGFHCGACGYDRCDDFARALVQGEADVDDCPYLRTERFRERRRRILKLLGETEEEGKGEIRGRPRRLRGRPAPGAAPRRTGLSGDPAPVRPERGRRGG
ncbi:MAG: (Fe-S)-binding protein [Euryarchaeota archaeon]